MITKHVQAVIFDMDGLMLDSQRLATKAWQRAVASFGFCLTDEINLRLIGRNDQDSNKILLSSFGPSFPLSEVHHLAGRNFTQLVEAAGIPVKPGLGELLDFLDTKAIPRAVATSTSRRDCIHLLEKANLISRFPLAVCGDEIQKGKPSPDLFLKAAQLLRAIPEKCVVLEDSFPGIKAASAAGMIPIMVPDMKEADEEMRLLSYAVVENLFEAKGVIQNIMVEE
jgi:HAD superfamily hydrolase (TIGR01509 family)